MSKTGNKKARKWFTGESSDVIKDRLNILGWGVISFALAKFANVSGTFLGRGPDDLAFEQFPKLVNFLTNAMYLFSAILFLALLFSFFVKNDYKK